MTSRAELEVQALAAESCLSEASTRDEALRRAIKAVELYMQAMRVAENNNERAQLKAKCQKLLRRAESLKKAAQAMKVPISIRTFTTKEQLILLEGSKLNGFIFRRWELDPDPGDFHLRDGEDLFMYGCPSYLYFLQHTLTHAETPRSSDFQNDSSSCSTVGNVQMNYLFS
ncbi:MAG: cysteine protease [Geoglossum umbratile]|nr:MAG: cysteine protease [Geoglossum umbratile]